MSRTPICCSSRPQTGKLSVRGRRLGTALRRLYQYGEGEPHRAPAQGNCHMTAHAVSRPRKRFEHEKLVAGAESNHRHVDLQKSKWLIRFIFINRLPGRPLHHLHHCARRCTAVPRNIHVRKCSLHDNMSGLLRPIQPDTVSSRLLAAPMHSSMEGFIYILTGTINSIAFDAKRIKQQNLIPIQFDCVYK